MSRLARLLVVVVALGGVIAVAVWDDARHRPPPSGLHGAPASPPAPAASGPEFLAAQLSVPPVKPGARCGAGQLAVRLEPVSGGSSHGGVLLVLTNHGRRCQVAGYPQLTLLDHERLVGRARQTPQGYLGGLRSEETPVVATLAPGHTASALYEANSGDPSCPAFDTIGVTPPGSTRSTPVTVPEGIYRCDVEIHPLKPTGPDPGPHHDVDDDGPLYRAYEARSGG